jgi:hypothetical protein
MRMAGENFTNLYRPGERTYLGIELVSDCVRKLKLVRSPAAVGMSHGSFATAS